MKVSSEKVEGEANEGLEASYFVEPGYVKQMIDRFSSGLPNDHINGGGEGGSIFKLPLLHSTKTKTREPFQYPILLANRSSIPVKSVVNNRGRKTPSGSSISSTGSDGSGSSQYNIHNNTNKSSINSSNMGNNSIKSTINSSNLSNNGKNLNGGRATNNSRECSPCKFDTSPTHTYTSPTHTYTSPTPTYTSPTHTHKSTTSIHNSSPYTQNSPTHTQNTSQHTQNSPSHIHKNPLTTHVRDAQDDDHQSPPPSSLPLHPHLNHSTLNNTNSEELCLESCDANSDHSLKTGRSTYTHNLHLNSITNINDLNKVEESDALEDSKLKGSLSGEETGDANSKEKKDGHHFLSLMAVSGAEMEVMCQQYHQHLEQPSITEAVQGKIRSAIGKANLLLTKKFKQFTDLCATNLTASKEEQFEVTSEDLEGFWDMMLIQIDDIKSSFQELDNIKLNHWQDTPPTLPSPLQSPSIKHTSEDMLTPTIKTPSKSHSNRSTKASKGSKGRSSGLQAAILAGRRQRKTSQSDEVVIFVADKTH